MVHGDNDGLRLPPRVAPVQIVIVPIPKKGFEDAINAKADEIETVLRNAGFRVEVDKRDNKPGWKYNYWETRGVPLRLELGAMDIQKNAVMVCRRDNRKKESFSFDGLAAKIQETLDDIHKQLFDAAKALKAEHTKTAHNFPEFIGHLNNKNIVLVPFCLGGDCEEKIKERSKNESVAQATDEVVGLTGSAKSLCRPLEQPALEAGTKCFGECGCDAKEWCLFGRSY